jgi:hypothetical protein
MPFTLIYCSLQVSHRENLVSDATDKRFKLGLLVIGLAGIGSSVMAYNRRGLEDAIVSALLWFGLGPIILFRYRSSKSKKPNRPQG